ncbi:Na/Pi cotransporter family protein [Orenia marismortui]|uniref:Na/Pi cotransporter family protein n=1 Tax=Orenia marismortui TaxID=46469 RepID=UPI00035E80D1|nr:Na/Pi symporter [Orenia marismortui]
MIFILIGKLILGLILFLLGMESVKDSFYKASGKRLEYLLKSLTNNIFISIITGMIVTMVIQSSSATTVIIISLVNANLLSLEQAFGVIMGANIGTTITVQLISFRLEEYLWVVIILGIIIYLLYYFSRKKSLMYIARGILGFAVLFVGLEILSNIISDFKDLDVFLNLLSYLSLKPMLGILLGLIITAIIQSSSALTGIIVVLAKANMINLNLAITLALGSNIGTCITAFIASLGSSKIAKRAAWAHILFNSFGVLVIIPILTLFVNVITLTSDNLARQIANAHTVFNIFNTVLVLPVRGVFIKLIKNYI